MNYYDKRANERLWCSIIASTACIVMGVCGSISIALWYGIPTTRGPWVLAGVVLALILAHIITFKNYHALRNAIHSYRESRKPKKYYKYSARIVPEDETDVNSKGHSTWAKSNGKQEDHIVYQEQ